MPRFAGVLPVLLAGLIASFPASAAYIFTSIATTESFFSFSAGDGLARPSINDSGVVAFWGEHQAPTPLGEGPFGPLSRPNIGIFTGAGGELTPIATTAPGTFDSFGTRPSINSSGDTAFIARAAGAAATSLYVGSGGAPVPFTINGSPLLNIVGAPDINASGEIAFVVRAGSEFFLLTNGDGSPGAAVNPQSGSSINSTGVIVSSSILGGLVLHLPSGQVEVAAIAPTNPGGFLELGSNASINDAGTVAFYGQPVDSGLPSIFTRGLGAPRVLVADTTGGVFSGFADGPSINNAGEVAFQAMLAAGGTGIFTGADPILDKVLQVGDALAGSLVTELSFFYNGLNASGQIAFGARLADGRQGIFRADPVFAVSAPQTVHLVLASLVLLVVVFTSRSTASGLCFSRRVPAWPSRRRTRRDVS